MSTPQAPKRLPADMLAGSSAVLGGAFWIASVGWYTQQSFDEDGLRRGWDAFNRLVTLIPLLFALPLYAIRIGRGPVGTRQRAPRSLLAVVICIVFAAICRLLVDLDVLPAAFAFVAIALFSITFLWYLIETLLSRAFSRLALGTLLGATLLMLAFIGTETDLVWFAAPFGVAWIVIGVLLLARPRRG